MSGRLVRCDDRAALDTALAAARAEATPIAFVPTMGALHHGHRALVERAATLAPVVVVSIFVNPTQFDAADDLAAYPRTLDADLDVLADVARTRDVTVVPFVPTVDVIYPDGPAATLHVPDVTDHLCGASRPGHFDGVATVVDALLTAVRPTVLVMGRKDHQQLVVVGRLLTLRGHPVTLDAAPTVRDDDAVAVSSRNTRLDASARTLARRIPRALGDAVHEVRGARATGDPVAADAVVAAARAALTVDGLTVDYVELVDAERIVPLAGPFAPDGEALLAVAVHVRTGADGSVRLIDNVRLGDVADEQRLLDALAAAPTDGPADGSGVPRAPRPRAPQG